jgi:hypothetical protein
LDKARHWGGGSNSGAAQMPFKFAAVLAVAAALISSPAVACMGQQVLFADNFQILNPAWVSLGGTMQIANGFAYLTPKPGDYSLFAYQGRFIDSADACIDVVNPAVADPSQASAGMVFGLFQGSLFVFAARQDGQAAILHYLIHTATWSFLVPWRAAPALKAGGHATNSLRITWKDNNAVAYINGQAFTRFNVPVFKNSLFGIWCEGDPVIYPTTGATYQFANLKITDVP